MPAVAGNADARMKRKFEVLLVDNARPWARRLLWDKVLSLTPWWHLRRQRKFRRAHARARADCEKPTTWRKVT